jgi:pyroglutamyl-peptidase
MPGNRTPRLLVIGFGPFPGVSKNPSGVAARKVAASPRWRILRVETKAITLATTYAAIEGALTPALAADPIDAVLMIGVAGRAREMRVETRALNRASLVADAAKVRPKRFCLAAGCGTRATRGKPTLQVATLRRHGFIARRSINAGSYLCNAAYFAALKEPMPVLFVHIPRPGRALRRRHGVRRRQQWHDHVAAALTDIAADLMKQARLARVRAPKDQGDAV